MPRYAVTTNFNETEIQKIKDKCKELNVTPYALLREATLKFVKEEVKHDGETRERESSPESVGRNAEADSQRGKPKVDAAEHGSGIQEYFDYLRATA